MTYIIYCNKQHKKTVNYVYKKWSKVNLSLKAISSSEAKVMRAKVISTNTYISIIKVYINNIKEIGMCKII